MFSRFSRAALAVFLLAFAPIVAAQSPQFRASATLGGGGTLNFPVGSESGDWLVMSVIHNAAFATPSGWTLRAQRNWTTYALYSYVFARQKGSDTSVVLGSNYGTVIAAYQNVSGIGSVGTLVESTASANTLSLASITPQHPGSRILGIVTDRDPIAPVPPATFATRINYVYSYFGHNLADRTSGSTDPSGVVAWGQSTSFAAVGVLVELLPPPATPPSIATSFSPGTIVPGAMTTITFNLNNPNAYPLTNANFTDTLTNLTVAAATIGGTCGGVSNSPALSIGATALNLTVPSLPSGGCSITVQVTSSTLGTHAHAASGVTTSQTPVAGAGSNTASLVVTSTPAPAAIATTFNPAWMPTGGTSTLTYALSSPTGGVLTNATFTNLLVNMTVANATIGGSCAGTSNSPALTVGATSLNLTVPVLPAAGCTITVQVTSATLGSNVIATSGVTTAEASAGAGSSAVLTVTQGDVGFSYVHADHLGTPRAITRPSDNALVWKWENSDPFGANLPNENPSGLGVFPYNLRHPGQYVDVETGTFYTSGTYMIR